MFNILFLYCIISLYHNLFHINEIVPFFVEFKLLQILVIQTIILKVADGWLLTQQIGSSHFLSKDNKLLVKSDDGEFSYSFRFDKQGSKN